MLIYPAEDQALELEPTEIITDITGYELSHFFVVFMNQP